MELLKLENNHIEECLNLWNQEVGFIYPLDLAMFKQKSIDCKYYKKDASFIIKEEEKIIGFVISKAYDNSEIIPKYHNVGWISLIYVARSFRKKGYGKILLENAEQNLIKIGVNSISIGSDIHNFFPGIPNDFDNTSDTFFRSNGYTANYYTHDLIKTLTDRDLVDYASYHNNSYVVDDITKDVILRYAKKEDKEDVLEFLKRTFYGRWYDEAIEYFNNNEVKKEYLLAYVDDKIVGFLRVNNRLINEISYNINWYHRFDNLVGFGPLGVDKDYRHNGIAKMLLYYAISDSKRNGYTHAMIDWTGLVTYYQKFGFETWKCYQYAKKEIK